VDGVRQVADEIGAQAVDVHGAVDGEEVIILSIPRPAVQALPAD
jgi:predicted dinucleotide-binding enzyme